MNRQHVYPVNDLKPHCTDSPVCWCEPVIDGALIIHNAADGREFFEDEEQELALDAMRAFSAIKTDCNGGTNGI
jgi:hypothetical protein